MPEISMDQRFEALRQFNALEAPQAESDVEAERLHRERMFSVPAQLVMAPYVTICSVWPERMVSQPFTHNGMGRHFYTIEPGSPGKPAYLLLQNVWDYVIQQQGQDRGWSQMPIFASDYGANIIQYWTGDHIANRVGKKGIGFIKGEYTGDPNNPVRATKAEIEELTKYQVDYLSFIVERADRNWDSGRPQDMAKAATRENRKALEMLGIDPEQHAWYKNRVARHNRCPRCQASMDRLAFGCKECELDLPDYFEKLELNVDAGEWPGVAKQMQLRSAIRAKTKKPVQSAS